MSAMFSPTPLKSLLECSICLNRFQDPRVLPCIHSYCLECLNTLVATTTANGAFQCPQCKERCVIPEGGAAGFPQNLYMNSLKDIVVPVGEPAPEAVAEDIMTAEGGTEQSASCGIHQGQPISKYCKTCSLPTCPECIAEKHQEHDTDEISAVANVFRADMLDVSKMAAERLEFLQTQSEDLNAIEMIMEEEFDEVGKDISDAADAMCRLIRHRETELQAKLRQRELLVKNVKRHKKN